MDIEVRLIGDGSLVSCREYGNEYDSQAVASLCENKIVGYVLQNNCNFFWRFLMLPRTLIYAQVLCLRVSRSAGNGLEVTVRFIFQGHTKCVAWGKINDADRSVED